MFIYLLQHVRQGARNVSNYKPCIRRLPFLNCLFLISFHNDGESEALFFFGAVYWKWFIKNLNRIYFVCKHFHGDFKKLQSTGGSKDGKIV